jgi:hypothetical protein
MIKLNEELMNGIEKYIEKNEKNIEIQEKPELLSGEKFCANTVIETKGELQKLTGEQKQKILYVFHDLESEGFFDGDSDPEYITEYDILMKQKSEEFKNHLLEDSIPSQIDALLKMCDEYIKDMETHENPFSTFGFAIMYDLWLNKSPIWPVPFNPEWEEWNKLKDKKVKRKKAVNKFDNDVIRHNCT